MRATRKWMLIPAAVVALAALVVAGVAFASQGKSTNARDAQHNAALQPVPVHVAALVKAQAASSLEYSGDVQASSTVTILPKVSGRIQKMLVDVGSRVKAGDELAELEHSQLDLQVQEAQAALDGAQAKLASLQDGGRPEVVAQAEANLKMAQAKLATMQDGSRPETIAQAEANLTAAQARLDALKKGPTPEQIAIAETQVRIAKDQLYAVQSQADAILGNRATAMGLTVYTQNMKEAQSGAASEQVKLAQAQLAALKAPPTKEMLDQAQAAVDAASQQLELAKHPFTDNDLAQAKAAVDAAKQAVALAKTPATDNDLQAANSAVEQARAALEMAKLQDGYSKIVAPVDGVVTQRLLDEGSLAAPTTPILVLASDQVEVTTNVEESRASLIAAGEPVTMTVSAYPGVTFDGTVKSVAPSVDPRSRTIAVKVTPNDPDGKLKPGMFAQLTITTSQKQSALLAPRAAVIGSGSQAAVFVVQGDHAYKRSVETGAVEGQNVEILAGATEGQKVVVQGQADLSDGQRVQIMDN